MATTIQDAVSVKNINVKDDTEFSFEYQANGSELKFFKVYAPTRDDYEVSIAVIDKAIKNEFNLIVYDFWIFPTNSGIAYSGMKKIVIFSVSEFVKTIKTGKLLENE